MLSLSGLVEERTLVALLELVLLVSFAGVVQRTSGFLTPTSLWCSKSKGQFSVNLTTYKKLTATAMMSSTTQPQGQEVIQGKAIQGLSEVAALYDVFLIDQWGVMHNGKEAYAGAVECIDKLAENGKKIVLLSNSSKRKGNALKNLERMGFSTGSILDVVTSGQIAWDELQRRAAEPFATLGDKCLVFGNGDEDEEYVTSCGCELSEADSADFILARGSFVVLGSTGMRRYSPTVMTGEGKAETDKAMQTMKQRGKPMLVTNPDFLRPGTNDPMPGLIGRAYEQMGGTVHYVGKPYSAVYDRCLEILQEQAATPGKDTSRVNSIKPSTIIAVGDSLPHDILGAMRTNIASVFVAGGVHFEELQIRQGAGDVPTNELCLKTFEKHLEGQGSPNHVVPAFIW